MESFRNKFNFQKRPTIVVIVMPVTFARHVEQLYSLQRLGTVEVLLVLGTNELLFKQN
jgi:hypothetical protein